MGEKRVRCEQSGSQEPQKEIGAIFVSHSDQRDLESIITQIPEIQKKFKGWIYRIGKATVIIAKTPSLRILGIFQKELSRRNFKTILSEEADTANFSSTERKYVACWWEKLCRMRNDNILSCLS